MTSVFEVAPFDGGWCVKIADTGEVLFFTTRRRAIDEAQSLARAWPLPAEIKVSSRRTPPSETWTQAPDGFAATLGAPA